MGNRIAPLLAISYINSLERRCIDRDVILYKRHIDDILIITKTVEDAQERFVKLNGESSIHLTHDLPQFFQNSLGILSGPAAFPFLLYLSPEELLLL